MWQQFDCNAANATRSNPSGCKGDLFPWVETTVGAGTNGLAQPAGFNDTSTREGSTSMGFYNMQQGDAPYLKYLADNFAISDNYHQAVMGGTGANHIMLGTGDAIWFSDGSGNPAEPPHNQEVWSPPARRTAASWTKSKTRIRNLAPTTGTRRMVTAAVLSDPLPTAAVATPTVPMPASPASRQSPTTWARCRTPINPNCDPDHYYLLNNYNPGYYGNGTSAYADIGNPNETVFTIPPSPLRSIGDALNEKNVSWAYFGDQWNAYLSPIPINNYGAIGSTSDQYCNICNFFQYSTSIMTNPAIRTAHI